MFLKIWEKISNFRNFFLMNFRDEWTRSWSKKVNYNLPDKCTENSWCPDWRPVRFPRPRWCKVLCYPLKQNEREFVSFLLLSFWLQTCKMYKNKLSLLICCKRIYCKLTSLCGKKRRLLDGLNGSLTWKYVEVIVG